MRKLVMLLALAGVSVFLLGAAAPVASAAGANCFTGQDPRQIYWTGYLQFDANVHGCTNVDLVQFSPYYNGTGPVLAGINDLSTGQFRTVAIPPSWGDSLCGRQYTTYTGTCHYVGDVPAYCGGQVHVVYWQVNFRIHNKLTNSWGSWVWLYDARESIVC